MNYTTNQYQYLERLYHYYNQRLFSNSLPSVMFTFARTSKSSGFFSSNKWRDHNGRSVHEISINPESIKDRYDIEFHQTLVHEMCHLWQQEFGKPGRKGYHNTEWAEKMISIGLMPSSTGREGGKITGQNMSDYFIEDGPFILAFKQIQENKMEPMPLEPENSHLYCKETAADGSVKFVPVQKDTTQKASKAGVRVKYTCDCGNNIWGKSDLKVYCLECSSDFIGNNL